ncbi:hypothetical protein ACO2Q8_14555 [Larkinella sp. VNQ87]|uniref:hypothetical protein n=1 Tax=Larkinella sp. VNQ87 TaxID=3400921 RepID=UPI003C0B273B
MKRFVLLAALLVGPLMGSAQDLDWNNYPEGELTNTFTNIGNIPVNATVEVLGMTSALSIDYPRPMPNGLELRVNFPTDGDCISLKVTFSQPVNNLNFNLLDIDRIDGDSQYQDQVTVTGSNGGTPVSPAIGTAVTNTISGNTITGINEDVNNSVNTISFSGPLTEITIQYCAGPEWDDPRLQLIYITNFNWDDAPALPVRLASFSGKRVENQVRLGWQTTFESNSAYFVVERSTDAKAFEALGRVVSLGFSESLQQYGFTDEAPVLGTNYYRLRQVDQDGRFAYSKIIGVGYDPSSYYFEARPVDKNRIEVLTNVPEPVFNVVDLRGLRELRQVETLGANRYLIHVGAGSLAAPSLKIVQLRTPVFSATKKLLIP